MIKVVKTALKISWIQRVKANFESAEDNLQDLATYAIMMLAYIKKGGDK